MLVGGQLINVKVERISVYFLENLRKKCDLHAEVVFCLISQTYRLRPGPTSFFRLFLNVLDGYDLKTRTGLFEQQIKW